jgi:Domain of unknown function (DUF4375)
MATAQKEPICYWSLIEPVWLPLNRSWDKGCEEFVRQFQAVPREVGHLYAGHWCQSEVCNGGFHQFFINTTGLLAPEALAGYRAIGLAEWAEVLATAMKFFGSQYPRERTERDELLPPRQRGRRESWDPFSQLDERFYQFTDRWKDAADAYAGQVSG